MMRRKPPLHCTGCCKQNGVLKIADINGPVSRNEINTKGLEHMLHYAQKNLLIKVEFLYRIVHILNYKIPEFCCSSVKLFNQNLCLTLTVLTMVHNNEFTDFVHHPVF
jgi:hypothetical protein